MAQIHLGSQSAKALRESGYLPVGIRREVQRTAMEPRNGFGYGAETIARQVNSHVRHRSAGWVPSEERLSGEVLLGLVETPGELQDRLTIVGARQSRHALEAPHTALHQRPVGEAELPRVEAAGPST